MAEKNRDMSILRDKIAFQFDAILAVVQARPLLNEELYIDTTVDAILRYVREAMLSEEAVEAGAAEIDSMRPYNVMDDAQFVIEAALAAAGITTVQGEEAGE